MKKFFGNELNNAQKATASLIGILVCINILPTVASASKSNPAVPAIVGLVAQVFLVTFVYFSLIWLKKD